jgi:hypothetical protein
MAPNMQLSTSKVVQNNGALYLVITLLQLGLQHLQAVLKAGGLLVGCLQTNSSI